LRTARSGRFLPKDFTQSNDKTNSIHLSADAFSQDLLAACEALEANLPTGFYGRNKLSRATEADFGKKGEILSWAMKGMGDEVVRDRAKTIPIQRFAEGKVFS